MKADSFSNTPFCAPAHSLATRLKQTAMSEVTRSAMRRKESGCRVSRSVPTGCTHTHNSKDDVNRITRDHWSRLVSPLQENFSLTDDDSDSFSACKKDTNPGFTDNLNNSPSPSSDSSSAKSSNPEGVPGQDNIRTNCACEEHHRQDDSNDGVQDKVCPNGQPHCRCHEVSNNATLKAREKSACLNWGVHKKHSRAPSWEKGVLTGDEGSWNNMSKCPKIDNLILVEPETVTHFDPVKKAQLRRDVSDCLKEEILRAKACVERETNRYRSYFNYKGKEILLDPQSHGNVAKVDHRNANYLNRLDDILRKKCIVEEDDRSTLYGKQVHTGKSGCTLNRRRSSSCGKPRKKWCAKSRHQLMNFPRSDKRSVFERLYQDAKHIKYANRDKDDAGLNHDMKDKKHVCSREEMRGTPSSHWKLGVLSPRSHHRLARSAEGHRGSCSFNTFKHDEDDVHEHPHRRFTEKQLDILENLPEDFTVQESKSLIKAIVSIIQHRFANDSKQKDNRIHHTHHCGAGDCWKENSPETGKDPEKQSAPKIVYSTRASDVARSVFRGGPLKASATGQFSKSEYTEPNNKIFDEVAASNKTNDRITDSGKVPSDTCLSTKGSRVDKYNLREEIDNIVRPRRSRLDTMTLRNYNLSLVPHHGLLDPSPTFKYRDLLTSGVPIAKRRLNDRIRNYACDNDDTTVRSFKYPFKSSLTTTGGPFSFELDTPLTTNNESYNRSPPFPTVFSSKSSRLRTQSETLIKTNPYQDNDPTLPFLNPVPNEDVPMDFKTVPKSSAFIKERTFLGNFSGEAKSSFLRMMEDDRPQKYWLDKVNDEQQRFVDISKGLDRFAFPKTGASCLDENRGSNSFHHPEYGVSPKPCPHDFSSSISRYGGDIHTRRKGWGSLHDPLSDSFKAVKQNRQRSALQSVKFSDTLRVACLENIASLKSFNSSLVNTGTKTRFLISNSLDCDSGEFETDTSKFDFESFKGARRKRDRIDSSVSPIDNLWGSKFVGQGDLDDLDALSCSADTIDTTNTSMTARLTELNQRFYSSSMNDWKTRYDKENLTANMSEHSADKLKTKMGGRFDEENTRAEPSPVVIEIRTHKTPSAPALELFESASTQTSENCQEETSPGHGTRTTGDACAEPMVVKKNSWTQVNPAKENSPNNSSQPSESSCTTPSILQSQALGSKTSPLAGQPFKGQFLVGRCTNMAAHSLLIGDKPDLGKALAILENFSPIKPVDIHTKYPLLNSRRLASQPNDSEAADDNSTWTGVSRSSSSLCKHSTKDGQLSIINQQASTVDDDRSQPNTIRNKFPVQEPDPQTSCKKANDILELRALHGQSAHQSTDTFDEMLVHLGSRRKFHRETLQQKDPMEKPPEESQKQSRSYGANELSSSSDSASCHKSHDKMPQCAETIISRIMKSRRDQFGISHSHALNEKKSSDDFKSNKALLDGSREHPNNCLYCTLDSDTSSERPTSLAGNGHNDSSLNKEVKRLCDNAIQHNNVKLSHEYEDTAPVLSVSITSNDVIRPVDGGGGTLTESGTGHAENVRHLPTTLTTSNIDGHVKESLSNLECSFLHAKSDPLDSAVSRHIENRALESASSKIKVTDHQRSKSAKNTASISNTSLKKCVSSLKPDVYKPAICSKISALRSYRVKPRDAHGKSGSYNANCLEDLKHKKDIVVIDVLSEPPGTPEPVTVKAYIVNSGVPVKVKSYQTRTSSPRFVVRALDSKVSLCENSSRKSTQKKEVGGCQNLKPGKSPASKSVQFNCPQDNKRVGGKFTSQSNTICANNNSKKLLHSGSGRYRVDLVFFRSCQIEASESDSSVTFSDHLTDDNHDMSSTDNDETSDVSHDDRGNHNNCNMCYFCNGDSGINSLTGDSLMITVELFRSMYDSSKSRPSLKLLGELAFQLERRILDYVFGMEDSKRRRFYGYTVSNIFSMMERETKFPKGGSDIITKSELAGRLKKLLQALEKYGYNIKTHGEFAQEMVNKYGLLACPPDESTIAQFGLNDPNAIAHLIQQLAQGPSEISSLTILLNSLKYLSKCDQRPLFIW